MNKRLLRPLTASLAVLFAVSACGSSSTGATSTSSLTSASSPSVAAPAASAPAGASSAPTKDASASAASSVPAAAGGDPKSVKLDGAKFVVSSKDFTESILLGKITADILKAHGADVTDKTNLKGSVTTRTALTSGSVDMYWEYTGTAWITYQKNTKPIADPKAQFDAVKAADAKNGIAWLNPTRMNDTYAMAIRESPGGALDGVKTLADLSKLDPKDATFCVESEFASRDDGLLGMLKAYGIKSPSSSQKTMDTGVIYTETQKGQACNFGEVFATDGRISALKLRVLQDNLHFFPNYNAALTLKKSMLDKYPGLATILNPVAAKLDNDTMTKLNAKVDADGVDPQDVADEWVKEQGFVS